MIVDVGGDRELLRVSGAVGVFHRVRRGLAERVLQQRGLCRRHTESRQPGGHRGAYRREAVRSGRQAEPWRCGWLGSPSE
jgi:hypothetical protein